MAVLNTLALKAAAFASMAVSDRQEDRRRHSGLKGAGRPVSLNPEDGEFSQFSLLVTTRTAMDVQPVCPVERCLHALSHLLTCLTPSKRFRFWPRTTQTENARRWLSFV